MIGIIDYGAGNLLSVQKAFDFLGVDTAIVRSVDDLTLITKMVLPGVGAFESAVNGLHSAKLFHPIKNWLQKNKPFLGICLGMQILFEKSEESENVKGFSIFKGSCTQFKQVKVPQIGWNTVNVVNPSKIFEGIKTYSFFYFLHGYFVSTPDDIVMGTTEYGVEYPSVIEYKNICAVQFHPEKSGNTGVRLLKNWVMTC